MRWEVENRDEWAGGINKKITVQILFTNAAPHRQSPQLLRQIIKLNPKQQQQRWREAQYCLILHSEGRQKYKDIPCKAPKRTEEGFSFPQELSTGLPTPEKESQPQPHHSPAAPLINSVYKSELSRTLKKLPEPKKKKKGNLAHRKRWLEVKRNWRTAYSDHESTALLVPSLHSNIIIMGFYLYLDSENADDVVRSFSPLHWLVFLIWDSRRNV